MRKLRDLISLVKVEGYKINIQKSAAFLYTNSELLEKLGNNHIYHSRRKEYNT